MMATLNQSTMRKLFNLLGQVLMWAGLIIAGGTLIWFRLFAITMPDFRNSFSVALIGTVIGVVGYCIQLETSESEVSSGDR
jgi:hypothetical protein